MTPSAACTFDIAAWHAVSSRLPTEDDWRAWAAGRLRAEDLPETKPEVPFLPAMQRRRLGLPARLLFQAAHAVADGRGHCPMVLASHDGEINRSFELWLQLLREGSVSPTSFGLSVHNATAGQWSMHQGDMSECTTLAVREDGLETAVLEAAGMLAEGAERVLVVLADDPLSAEYAAAPAERAPFAYALALLLERGASWTLSPLHGGTDPAEPQQGYWGALDWVRRRYAGETAWISRYGCTAWQWRQN